MLILNKIFKNILSLYFDVFYIICFFSLFIFRKIGSKKNTYEDIVIVSSNNHERAKKIAKALNYKKIQPYLITQNDEYDPRINYSSRYLYKSKYHAIYILLKKFHHSKIYVLCNWDYFIPFLLIKNKIGKVYVDSFDILNFFTKVNIQKKYKRQLYLEKYCLTKAEGLVCRDLRTNLLKRNGWLLPKRILFMDYYDKNKRKIIKKLDKKIAYVGNFELDINNNVAWQYEFSKKLNKKKIFLTLFPSVKAHYNKLIHKFQNFDKNLLKKNSYIHLSNTIPSRLLEDYLKKFSFGLLVSTKNVNFNDDHDTYNNIMDRYFFAAKIFDYYNAGICPLVQNSLFVKFILKRLNAGCVVNSIEEIITRVEKNYGQKIIFNFTSRFSVEGNSNRLFEFFYK